MSPRRGQYQHPKRYYVVKAERMPDGSPKYTVGCYASKAAAEAACVGVEGDTVYVRRVPPYVARKYLSGITNTPIWSLDMSKVGAL